MALGNAYAAVTLDADGNVVDSTAVVQFTDADEQPGPGGSGANLFVQPTDPGAVGTGKLWVDTSGDPTLKQRNGDDDGWSLVRVDGLESTENAIFDGDVTVATGTVSAAEVDATLLQVTAFDPTTVFVGSQAGPPDPIDTFTTPLVYDTTAVTGGAYAWNGAAYVQISNVVT